VEAAVIRARARDGEPAALAAIDRYAGRMARGLASVINVLDPDTVVLGGGLSNIEGLYERVPALWQPFVFSDTVRTRLVPARYGDSSGVRGAAWLWR
jgi:fructokinase